MRKEIQKRILTLAFLLLATLAVGQTLKGKVTDNEKEPLLGVTIIIKNTSRGTTTNEKGEITNKEYVSSGCSSFLLYRL